MDKSKEIKFEKQNDINKKLFSEFFLDKQIIRFYYFIAKIISNIILAVLYIIINNNIKSELLYLLL